jgi:hypothetical protein
MKIKIVVIVILLAIVALLTIYLWRKFSHQDVISMSDDFENGLDQWEFFDMRTMPPLPDEAGLVDTKDKAHGKALSLSPGQLIALIKGSDGWSNYKVEGDVYFPHSDSLMGLVYNLNLVPRPDWAGEENKLRTEFGCIYIKCGGSYIRVNPHYDGTAGRALYEDYRTPLVGDAAIKPGEWKHFRYEVFGGDVHLYVGDMEKPQLTFPGYYHTSGRVGFRPRSGGSECWVDNVQVSAINELSFDGQVVPEGVTWEPDKLITDWDAIGPFSDRIAEIEESEASTDQTFTVEGQEYKWASFAADNRGCVISGKISDFIPPERRLVYLRTHIHSDVETDSKLRFSSRSTLKVFVNGKAVGTIREVEHIWPDFWKTERHNPTDVEVSLKKGDNHIVVLVDGGWYPGSGFYAYAEPVSP